MGPIMALCASHLTSMPRLKALMEMVNSWRGQVAEIPLRLSVSCDPVMTQVTTRVIEQLTLEHGSHGLSVDFVGSTRRSQFEHYRDIARSTSIEWVMFSDDDDVWHPERSLHVIAGIQHIEDLKPTNENVLSIRVAGAVEGDLDRGTAEAVERAMEIGEITAMPEAHDEYWMFACRLKTLQDFVERADTKLIKSPYCDMYFLRYTFSKTLRSLNSDNSDNVCICRYLRCSIGYQVLHVPLLISSRWTYAYRGIPRVRRVTKKEISHTAEEHLALLYAVMPLGRQDAATRERKARAHGIPVGREREWTRLVDGGAIDAYVFSPMPISYAV